MEGLSEKKNHLVAVVMIWVHEGNDHDSLHVALKSGEQLLLSTVGITEESEETNWRYGVYTAL